MISFPYTLDYFLLSDQSAGSVSRSDFVLHWETSGGVQLIEEVFLWRTWQVEQTFIH